MHAHNVEHSITKCELHQYHLRAVINACQSFYMVDN